MIIIQTRAVAIMSRTQSPPAPVDSSSVGPRAKALTASIKQAGSKASEADRALQAITSANFPHNQSLDDGITGIVLAIQSSISSITEPLPEFTVVEQNDIYNAFKGFLQDFRQLVKSMMDKHKLMAPNPVKGNALAGFLFSCKAFVNQFAIVIIRMLPSHADDAQLQVESFDSSLIDAIDTFRSSFDS
ncbi:hypothetical protein KVR01_013632 [Diaporthe batatas]|uniref:uncharacterized protein n=1 Tax=Diaporthe batatas TaxID=748121 RepID=UPI001D047A53|nr:uncharacterized protein KVR01_013632 [Diaporthe batatas]KAG8156528.1 hypothetical protein KVR01_013632 [Diaporthe batatas]